MPHQASLVADPNQGNVPREIWRATLYFTVVVLLFFREPLLFPVHFHIPYDVAGYHYPLSDFIAWSLREFHQLPWWNPFSYMGQPFYGNSQAAIFYPPTLLMIALGNIFLGRFPFYLLELQLALHVVLAGIGSYLLIRSLKASFWSSLAGGTIYCVGAFFASQTQHLGVISAAAWLPWFMLALCRLEERRDLKSMAIAGLCLALMILPGFPAGYLPAFIFGPLFYGFWMWQRRPHAEVKSYLRPLGLILGVFTCGILVSAVSWLPAYGISRVSAATQRPTAQATNGYPVEAATSFFWPNLFGQLGTESRASGNPTFLHLYQGIPALLLVLGGVGGLMASRRARPFLAGSLLALLWMFGTGFLVSEIIYLLFPYFVRRGIYPQYVFAYFCLYFAVLAALNLDAHENGERPEIFKYRLVWWAAVACVLVALVVAAAGSLTAFGHYAATSAASLLWVAFVLAICGFLAQQEGLASTFTRTRLSAILCFLIAVDLIVVGSDTHLNNAPGPGGYTFSAVQFLRDQLGPLPLYRVDTSGVWDEWQTRIPEWRIPSANGMDPLLLLSTEAYQQPFSKVQGRVFSLTSKESPLLDLAGVRYIVTSTNALGDMPRVYHGEVNIFENTRAFRRFFLVGAITPAVDIASAVAAIGSGQVDPARVAVIPSADLGRFTGLSTPASTEELGKVELLSYSPNALRLRVESSKPAVLVATETFWKDWQATVDGARVPITAADGLFRAVAVPAGAHEISMFIVPVTLYVAAAISGCALIACLLLGFGPGILRKRVSTDRRAADWKPFQK